MYVVFTIILAHAHNSSFEWVGGLKEVSAFLAATILQPSYISLSLCWKMKSALLCVALCVVGASCLSLNKVSEWVDLTSLHTKDLGDIWTNCSETSPSLCMHVVYISLQVNPLTLWRLKVWPYLLILLSKEKISPSVQLLIFVRLTSTNEYSHWYLTACSGGGH